ncbi:permease-like cell division protein FtsX [bacterium]|nr:permease-like cell division protein FtsX [bacterium]
MASIAPNNQPAPSDSAEKRQLTADSQDQPAESRPQAAGPAAPNAETASASAASQSQSAAPGQDAGATLNAAKDKASSAAPESRAISAASEATSAGSQPAPAEAASGQAGAAPQHSDTSLEQNGKAANKTEPKAAPAPAAKINDAVPPPPVLKPLPPGTAAPRKPALVQKSSSKKKNKKFPSIAPPSPGDAAAQAAPADDEAPRKRYTPSGGYYLECFLREVVTNIRRNPMMSIASISTAMVLALILGMFTLVIANLDQLAQELAREMQIKVYMANSFPSEEAQECQEHLLRIEHVTGVVFVPKSEAFAKLRERLGGRISLEDIEQNPLPDAFQVSVDDPKYLDDTAQRIHEITTVEKVDYGRDEASKLLALNKTVRLAGFVILGLLFASTILIVSNTIRLTVFARRKEIDIMQLVGAADWFIRWPFILEGVFQGLIGASLSALALDLGYRLVVPHFQRSIAFIPVILPNAIIPYLWLGLTLMGCAVGAIGSLISVNRYLKA